MDARSRIFVAGGDTLIGAAILRRLDQLGFENVVGRGVGEPDLRDAAAVERFFADERPEYVFLAAGRSGGIGLNREHPAELMLDNLLVQTNVLKAAHEAGVQNLLYLASSCSYPKHAAQPMAVESLFTDKLEPTNEAYATAKLAGIVLCQSYAKQYGRRYLAVIPANGFGIEDDFTPEGGHVIPALLARMHEAKLANAESIDIWGSGRPRREFLFADDLADGCLFLMDHAEDATTPINLGGGDDVSIAELAEEIRDVVGFEGELRFDTSKPDGMPLKSLDSSAVRSLGWQPETDFATALTRTYEAYLARSNPRSPGMLHQRLYESLYRIRRTEEEIAKIYPSDKIKSPVHLSIGQEAISVGVCEALREDDVVFGTYRGHAMYLAKGGDLNAMVAEMYGKETGCTSGKGGSMHLVDPDAGVMGTSAVVGTSIANAAGAAYALKLQKSDRVVVCFFGDGATEEGVFAETLNFAALKQLPIVFVCENNGYAIHTSQAKRQGRPDIAARAKAYGIPTAIVEGNDCLAVHEQTTMAVDAIRSGVGGPFFIEAKTYRWREHVGPGEDFHLGFRDADERDPWMENDEVARIGNLLDDNVRDAIEADVEVEVAAAIEFAETSDFPPTSELMTHVYATTTDDTNEAATPSWKAA